MRNLKSALIAYHANDHTSWDQNLSWIQFAFNSAYHEGHKSTPFELLYKYKPNHPLSTKWKIHELLPHEISGKNIKKIWNEARANLRANLRKSRKYHERNNKVVKYQVGDLVMYRTHPTSSAIDKTTSKLSYRWCGPYKIYRYLTPVTVALYEPTTQKYVRRSHISQIKYYHERRNASEQENKKRY